MPPKNRLDSQASQTRRDLGQVRWVPGSGPAEVQFGLGRVHLGPGVTGGQGVARLIWYQGLAQAGIIHSMVTFTTVTFALCGGYMHHVPPSVFGPQRVRAFYCYWLMESPPQLKA